RLSRAGRVEYRWEMVDVNRIVRAIVGAAAGTVQEKGATVTFHELPPVWGDTTALEQVFANLFNNALAYLDPNRAGVIEVGSRAEGANDAPQPRLYYGQDNGLRIAEAYQQKIFQVC